MRPRFALIPVYFAFVLDNFGMAVIIPILSPLFLRPEFALLPETFSLFHKTLLIGLTIAAFPIAQFFGAPLIGEYSDQIGRKKMFAIAISGITLGYAGTALGILLLNFPLIFAGRLFSGFFAGNLTICLASVADWFKDPNERTRIFGRLASLGGLFFIAGIIIGSQFSSFSKGSGLTSSIPLWMVSFFSLITLLLILFLFEEHKPPKKTEPVNFLQGLHHILSAVRQPNLRTVYAAYFFFMVCWISSLQFAVTFLIQMLAATASQIQTALLISGSVWALTNALMSKWLKRKTGFSSLYRFFLICLTCVLLLFWLPRELWQFIILFSCTTFCSALSWTLAQSSVSLRATEQNQGRSLGINQSIGALAAIAGPLLSGALAGVNVRFVYFFAALSSFIAFLIISYDSKRKLKIT